MLKCKSLLNSLSNLMFFFLGILMALSSIAIVAIGMYQLFLASSSKSEILYELLNFVGLLIIAAAIFDVGRYLLEEEVFRDREIRSPREARQSLTKFMVIIVIAVTLESLLAVIKASSENLHDLIYPAALFLVATALLVGLGTYQRLSILTEIEVEKKN